MMTTYKISEQSFRGYKAAVTRKLTSASAACRVASLVLMTVKANVELLVPLD